MAVKPLHKKQSIHPNILKQRLNVFEDISLYNKQIKQPGDNPLCVFFFYSGRSFIILALFAVCLHVRW